MRASHLHPRMTAQYSFLSTCQQIAQEQLGQFDVGPGPSAIQQSGQQLGQQEQKVKKREKLLSLFGGLLPATRPHSDPDGKEIAADHATSYSHDKKGSIQIFNFSVKQFGSKAYRLYPDQELRTQSLIPKICKSCFCDSTVRAYSSGN